MNTQLSKLKEKILEDFEKEKRNWEIYGALGMGIAYPKLKSWLEKTLSQFEADIRKEWKKREAMIRASAEATALQHLTEWKADTKINETKS